MKDMKIKEIEEIKEAAQNLMSEIMDKYECMTPMIIESIEVYEDEETGKNQIRFIDFYNTKDKTYIKNGNN